MLPKKLLDQVKAINVHGSLLPRYRGGAPIQYALFDGLTETGVTIMYMAYQMDSGDVIKQEAIPIEPKDNYQSLSIKLSYLGARLLNEVLEDVNQNKIERKPQDINQVSFAYTLKQIDEWISFKQTSEQIINRIRGLSPDIGATAFIKNATLKFYQAQKSDIIDDKAVPGTILVAKKQLIIKTVDGSIEILQIQAPGKKSWPSKTF